MKYLDFDLVIESSGDGFVARVFNSPGGQATSEFAVPFSDLELENFLLRMGRSRHAVRRIESPELTSAKVFGGRLFNSVFAGDVRGCLRSSLDEAHRQNVGLRVRLHLGKAPALADLPWEFLYNQPMNRFLGLSVETPLVRFLDLPERIRPVTVKPPLRILMMISSPTDFPQLDVAREASKMTEALADLEARGLVQVERQEVATLAELQKRLRQAQFHIFHFIGHGGFDDQAQDGVLILENDEERGRRVPAQFLGTLLHDHRPLRLAVLNACEGARASRSDPFAGTAQSLVQQGIPAVIAMQFEVTDEAAICFTREFYSAIATGYPVDAALAEARKAIFAEVSEIEWGTPVLYMRSPDGMIFEVEQVSEADRRQMQISSLLTAARTAAAANDEATAVAKAKELLALDPGNADAASLLREIGRQKDLAAAYADGRGHFDAGRFTEALVALRRVQSIDRDYRDVTALIATAERTLSAAADAEARARRVETLRREARDATHAERWDDAIQRWQALQIELPDEDLRAHIEDARRQQKLATLYARGRSHFELKHWKEALAEFHQLHRLANPYKDAAKYVARIEAELKEAAAREAKPVAPPPPLPTPAAPQPLASIPAATPAVEPQPPRTRAATPARPQPAIGRTAKPARAKYVIIGGLIGAVGLGGVLFLIIVIVLAALDDATSESPTPTPAAFDSAAVIPAPAPGPAPAPAPMPSAPSPAPYNGSEMIPAPDDVRQRLQEAQLYASNVEIQAYQNMNRQLLQTVYAGNLLRMHEEEMTGIASHGGFAVKQLHSYRFGPITVSRDGQRATVQVTERWSVNLHSLVLPGRPCVGHIHERDVTQTVQFQRTGSAWLAYEGTLPTESPDVVGCH